MIRKNRFLIRTAAKPVAKITTVALLSMLVACDGAVDGNGTSTGNSGFNVVDSTNPDSTTPDSTSEAQEGGDEYWAELAQEYEAFVKPADLGAAEPTDWISIGRWEDTFDWPVIATGAANMPDGRIVAWSSTAVNAFGGDSESTHGTIYNPDDGSFTNTPNSNHNMFCAGVSLLEDGRIFVAGGGATVKTTSIFDGGQFTETDSMTLARWYPTSTTIASGQVFTSLGTISSPYPEIWTDGLGWNLLPTISLQTIIDDDDVVHNDWYPALHVAPDGSLFHPGHMPGVLSIYMDQEDPVHEHGDRTTGEESRLYSTTVMYDIGKMLIAGGGQGGLSTNTAMTMDVNGITPVITPTSSMKHVRSMQNSVVLPTGEVLVVGGNTSGIQFSDSGTVLEPEMWNPVTEEWRTLAFHDKPRNYHSVAVLMKDARVLVAGGGLCGACLTNHQDGEIFSPPYLFDAIGSAIARPTISTGDATALPGDTISITGTDDIVKFNMLRLVAITHHHTTDQRFVPIDSVKTATGEYSLTLNTNPNVLLPGNYWIFGIDQNGTPTEGHTIQINVTPENAPDTSIDSSTNVEYEYFEETWTASKLPDFDSLTPVKTGNQADFSLDARERDDQYAFRFKATLQVPVNGEYTFFLSSDDGSKLLLDDQVIVNHDGVHGFGSEKSGTVNLNSGSYELEVQFFEYAGDDALLVSWEGPETNKQAIQSSFLGDQVDTADYENSNSGPELDGLISYRYYEGAWTSLPNFDNETIIKEGEIEGFDLSPRLIDNYYGFEFTANLTIPETGEYTFYTTSDDGSILSIDGVSIVNNDGLHPAIQRSGTISLVAGTYKLKVEFFEFAGGDSLTVDWSGPGFTQQSIPSSAVTSNGSVDDGTVTDTTTDTGYGPDTTYTTTDTSSSSVVNYEYFEGTWTSVPNFDSLVPVAQGEQASFSLAPKQIDDNYGFRFATYVEVPADGLYTFYIASDDGSRLHINGQLLIDNDGLHASREYNASQYLTAGTHHVLVEYFERTGLDTLDVSWSATDMAKQLLQNATLTAAPFDYTETDVPVTTSATTGVNFEYFEGTWTTLPNFDLLTPVSTGELDQFTLPASNGELFYGYRFTSQIQIDEAGLYTFYTLSNDGSQLHIDDNLIVDNNGKHGAVEAQGAVTLSAGLHNITVTYFQSGGTEALNVYWSSANMAKQIIDSSVLFTP